MTSREVPVVVDIPCDVRQEDETRCVWAFLDEARDPSPIAEGAIVVSGDDLDPVFARVVSLTARPGGPRSTSRSSRASRSSTPRPSVGRTS